jgi:predicted RNA binding protein YcfA (HicA-like mRNA interferase family)
MTRIAKLHAYALANPRGLSFREFEKLLGAFGFTEDCTVGSHRQYVHLKVP